MAVYQGTRPRAVLPTVRPLSRRAPGARHAAPLERRSPRARSRAGRRASPVLFALVGVVGVFMVGLVYLTQMLQVGALDVEVNRLLVEREAISREIQNQQGTIAQWGAAPQVIDWANQHGLDPLGGKLRVPRP